MWRINRATGQNDFLRGGRRDGRAVLPERYARAPAAIEQQAGCQCIGFNPKIGPAAGFFQKGLSGRPAPLAFPGHLRIADPFLDFPVQVFAEGEPGFLRTLHEAMRQWKDGPVILDLQRAAFAAELWVTALLVIFRLAKEWQHVIETPAAATHLSPVVEVGGVAANIEHTVDGAGSAKGFAARPVDGAAATAFGSLGAVIPVNHRMVQQF